MPRCPRGASGLKQTPHVRVPQEMANAATQPPRRRSLAGCKGIVLCLGFGIRPQARGACARCAGKGDRAAAAARPREI